MLLNCTWEGKMSLFERTNEKCRFHIQKGKNAFEHLRKIAWALFFYQLKCWYIVSQCIEMEFLNRANVYNLNEQWKQSAIINPIYFVCCGWNLSIFFHHPSSIWMRLKMLSNKSPSASWIQNEWNSTAFFCEPTRRALEQDKWLVGFWKVAFPVAKPENPFLINFRNKIKPSDAEGITQIEEWWSNYNYWATRKE